MSETYELFDRFSSRPTVWLRLSWIVSRGGFCAWHAYVYFVCSWPSRKKCRWGKEGVSWFFVFSDEYWGFGSSRKKRKKDSCSLVSFTLKSDLKTIFLNKDRSVWFVWRKSRPLYNQVESIWSQDLCRGTLALIDDGADEIHTAGKDKHGKPTAMTGND